MALSRPLRLLRGLALTLPWLAHLTFADLLISFLLPVSYLFPAWTYTQSSRLAARVWAHVQDIFEKRNGAQIVRSYVGFSEISGNDVKNDDQNGKPGKLEAHVGESALVISNHVSWTDFYMLQALARSTEPSMLPYQRYFAKSSLRFVPLLGWGLWALRMPLVSRRWTDDRAEIERVFKGPRDRREPIWLVMFSEGTRWSTRKWEQAVAWAAKKGTATPGQYVLLPRSKGFIASMKGLRDGGIASVIDVTIAYATKSEPGQKGQAGASPWNFMKAPDMWTTLSDASLDENYRFWVHAERFDIADLPRDDAGLGKWIEQRWRIKGERLQRLGDKLDGRTSTSGLAL